VLCGLPLEKGAFIYVGIYQAIVDKASPGAVATYNEPKEKDKSGEYSAACGGG
jgi:hypothetical protein